jgi:hypothetical protein
MLPSKIDDFDEVALHPIAPLGMTYLHVAPNDEFQKLFGISQTRETIVEFIQEQGIRRPMQNLERKKMEMTEKSDYFPDGSNWPRDHQSSLIKIIVIVHLSLHDSLYVTFKLNLNTS